MDINNSFVSFEVLSVDWVNKKLHISISSLVSENERIQLPLEVERVYNYPYCTHQVSLKLDDNTIIFALATDEEMKEFFPDMIIHERKAV